MDAQCISNTTRVYLKALEKHFFLLSHLVSKATAVSVREKFTSFTYQQTFYSIPLFLAPNGCTNHNGGFLRPVTLVVCPDGLFFRDIFGYRVH